MFVNATGTFTTKAGLQAVVESVHPATGYIVREDGTTTRHIWQNSGRHHLNKRSSQIDIVKAGYTAPSRLPDGFVSGGVLAVCVRKDGQIFQPLRATLAELNALITDHGWEDMVERIEEVRPVARVA